MATYISNTEKFRLLMWKNFILLWNSKMAFIIELFGPAIVFFLFSMIRHEYYPVREENKIYDDSKRLPIDTLDLLRENTKVFLNYHLAYSPNSSLFEGLIKEAAGSLKITYTGFSNAKEMEEAAIENKYLAGVDFGDEHAKFKYFPLYLSYTLRFPGKLRTERRFMTWQTNRRFVAFDPIGPRNEDDIDGGNPVGYLREGFLPVQHAISSAYMRQISLNDDPQPRIYLQRYPHSTYIDDPLLWNIHIFLSVTIALSHLYPSQCRVGYITLEKEKQLKDVMKVMGLQNWLHWLAWFVISFAAMAISSLLTTISLLVNFTGNGSILRYSSFMPVLLFFLMYTITIITFCFMLAMCFSRATTAATMTGVILFFMYFPFLVGTTVESGFLSPGVKMCWCLMCNTALAYGLHFIAVQELVGEGLQWNNMNKHPDPDDPVSMIDIMLMMLLACIIHIALCLYMEQVCPGELGVPQPWYFPFTKSYWFRQKEDNYKEDRFAHHTFDPESFQAEPEGNVGLQVMKVTKRFGDNVAIKNVSLNVYENEITVLVGHNGAGKTVLISILTGINVPTKGTVTVNGFNIRKNLEKARMSMGFCPQYNVLFDDLTVRQHLIFYSRLKGLKNDKLTDEVEKLLEQMHLENKANVKSSNLPMVMKRKLSLCTAFCGNTKVVILDEPSWGMDPLQRKELWEFIHLEKNGRTVLLTTNFMDEAEALGDRIAVISCGVLQGAGSPLFLRQKFGGGFHLVCVKQPGCDTQQVTNLLRKYIANIEPESDGRIELTYRLPHTYSPKFREIFTDLESSTGRLKLVVFSVAGPSMEDVFLKVGTEEMTKKVCAQNPKIYCCLSESAENLFADNQNLVKGSVLLRNQWHAMILKKYLSTVRGKFILAFQIIFPILFIFLSLYGIREFIYEPEKSLPLDLKQIPSTVTVLEREGKYVELKGQPSYYMNYKKTVEKFGSDHKLIETQENFIDYLLEVEKTDQSLVDHKYLAAATVYEKYIIVWLNNKLLHSAPVSLNLAHNAMSTTMYEGSVITVANHPLPLKAGRTIKTLDGTNFVLVVSQVMSFTIPLFVIFVIDERNIRAKLLQFVSGVKATTFWLSHLVCDMIMYILTSLVIVIAIILFQYQGFATRDEAARYMVLIILFGFSMLPFIYLISRCHREAASAIATLIILNVFFEIPSYFAWQEPGVLKETIYLLVTSIVFILILILTEGWDMKGHLSRKKAKEDSKSFVDDVEQERERIKNMKPLEIAEQNLVLDRVTKLYGKQLAVNQISLTAGHTECFVLLGLNGAGKTKTLKILTGDEKMSSGEVYVKGNSLKKDMNLIYYEIGYCPQDDALFKNLTGRETLKIFCLLRGIPNNEIPEISKNVAIHFGIIRYYDQRIHTYSGVNKRRLSSAIAVLSGQSVIYLDEPTIGMDPGGRRQIWKVIGSVRDAGKTIIITSHAMDDCEAVCTRSAIMVKGEFRCMSSLEYLRNTYGQGYMVKIKIKKKTASVKKSTSGSQTDVLVAKRLDGDIGRICEFMEDEFPECVLQNRFQAVLTFSVPFTGNPWSKMFHVIEAYKQILAIEEYAICQITLESIFLQIASQEREEKSETK